MQVTLNTKDQLLRLLRVRGPQTAAQLSEQLGIGSTAVRQHLDRLQAEGWIEVVGLRRGVGRPSQLFGLTEESDRLFPQQYDHLALELLDAIETLPQGDQLLRQVLGVRREKWNQQYGPRLADKRLNERVEVVTDIFNERGNMAEYQTNPDGTYMLIEHHCSVCDVVKRFPLLCEEDKTWLEEALQAQVDQLESRALGDSRCVFRIAPLAEPRMGEGHHSPGEGR